MSVLEEKQGLSGVGRNIIMEVAKQQGSRNRITEVSPEGRALRQMHV